ncbi:MarR family winged helix-turn-helix transcriptional regulator [Pararoseomonas indoligenes]|uniref:MarR family transcriptional regulator n=1 Tax=Roseomonas indoligenes TaxID=2820811 RepID=A0A940MXZ9_9PROT|nr:MarR family transcriptional regulator [Pararoseomonas indoligenes]MBP0492526.1 MarR family transcriptional regulator [Pararoseomonas indoligenes]
MSDSLPRPAELLCFSVYAAAHAMNRVYKPLLDPLGLTYPQYLVMLTLWDEDGQTVGQVSERLFLESSTITPLLKRLETAGLLTRERDRADERVVRARLTEAGRALREKALGIPACILGATGLDMAAAVRLRDDVERLRHSLERAAGEEPPSGGPS